MTSRQCKTNWNVAAFVYVVSGEADSNAKLHRYKRLLLELPSVNYSTLKRLILHLSQYVFSVPRVIQICICHH